VQWCYFSFTAAFVKRGYSSEKNRSQSCLTVCNFKPDDVFTDVFCKSGTRVLDKLFEKGNSEFDIAPLIDRRCRASIDDIRSALDGELTLAQTEKLKLIRQHMENLDNLKSTLTNSILRLAVPYQPQIDLLPGVPGISTPLTAVRISAEIGADMSVFETAKHLCSWAGPCPQNNESANKKRTTKNPTNKGGAKRRFRRALCGENSDRIAART
jgi:transposase